SVPMLLCFDLAQQLSDPFIFAYAFIWASLLHLHRGEWQLCYERAEEAISLSYEHNFPFWLAIGSIFKGYALANQGQTELGVSLMCYGLDAERATGGEVARPYFLTFLAETLRLEGQVEEGLTLLDEAMAIVNRTQEYSALSYIYHIKGELLLMRVTDENELQLGFTDVEARKEGKSLILEDATDCFRRAIETSQLQQAK